MGPVQTMLIRVLIYRITSSASCAHYSTELPLHDPEAYSCKLLSMLLAPSAFHFVTHTLTSLALPAYTVPAPPRPPAHVPTREDRSAVTLFSEGRIELVKILLYKLPLIYLASFALRFILIFARWVFYPADTANSREPRPAAIPSR